MIVIKTTVMLTTYDTAYIAMQYHNAVINSFKLNNEWYTAKEVTLKELLLDLKCQDQQKSIYDFVISNLLNHWVGSSIDYDEHTSKYVVEIEYWHFD